MIESKVRLAFDARCFDPLAVADCSGTDGEDADASGDTAGAGDIEAAGVSLGSGVEKDFFRCRDAVGVGLAVGEARFFFLPGVGVSVVSFDSACLVVDFGVPEGSDVFSAAVEEDFFFSDAVLFSDAFFVLVVVFFL